MSTTTPYMNIDLSVFVDYCIYLIDHSRIRNNANVKFYGDATQMSNKKFSNNPIKIIENNIKI